MMNFQKAFKILSKDIEEIEKILTGFQKSDPEEKMILQLVLSKLKNLKENFHMMSEGFATQDTFSAEEGKRLLKEEEREKTAEEKVAEEAPVSPDKSSVTDKKDTETIAIAEEQPSEKKEKTETGSETENQSRSTGKSKAVLSDRFQHQQYRNESLARKNSGKNLSAKLQEQPIKDIYKSIAVNERFQYIKVLFHGDSKVFNQTIQYLNQVGSEEEALTYIREHFDWDPDHTLVQDLLGLVRRKLKR